MVVEDGEITELSLSLYAEELKLGFFPNDDEFMGSFRELEGDRTASFPTVDNILSQLSALPKLERLRLGCGSVPLDAQARNLRGLRSLETLDLAPSVVTDNALLEVGTLKSLKDLSVMAFRGSQVTDVGVQHLANLKELERLDISQVDVSAVGLSRVKNMSSLKSLSLGGPRINDGALVELSHVSSLEALGISQCSVTSEGIRELTTLRALERFGLDASESDAEILNAISILPALKYVTLHNASVVNDTAINQLPTNHGIEVAVIRGAAITDESLSAFSAWKGLKKLDLVNSQITAAGVCYMAKEMRHIKLIHSVPQAELSAYMREHSVATQGSVEDLASP